MASLKQLSQDAWDDVMATNARGVWLSMRYEIKPCLDAVGEGPL